MAESVEIDTPEVVHEELEDDDVEAIISRANKLIETVNRDRRTRSGPVSTFSNSPPHSTPTRISPLPQRSVVTESSPNTSVVVDIDFDEIDNAIESINRFCKSFDENQRPDTATHPLRRELFNTLFDNLVDSSRPEQLPTLTSTNDVTSNATAPHVDEIIDLSNTQSFSALPTAHHARSNNVTNDADDDVVIVYSTLNEVVDLCTPVRPAAANIYLGNRPNLTNNTNHTNPVIWPRVSTAVVNSTKSTKGSTKKPPKPSRRSRSPIPPAGRSQSPTKTHLKCPVCMDSAVDKKPTSTKCGHVFCGSCINQAIRLTRKCPMCNTKLTPSQLFRIYL